MRLVFSFFVFAFVIFTNPAFADPVCDAKEIRGYEIRWCYEAGAPTSGQVIYYFHGIGSNEKRWAGTNLHEALNQHLARSPALRPHVFSISFGRAWFFTDENRHGQGSRLNAFLEDALPQLEAGLPVPVTRRTVVGESMGGYNALRLMMEAPALFSQVVSLCPALLPIGPYSSSADIDAFKQRNSQYLEPRRLETIRWWALTEFPNQASWTRNNPLDRSAYPIASLPPLFLAQDVRDEYGFPEGTTLFASRLVSQGHAVSLRTDDAGHCRHSQSTLDEASNLLVGM